MIRDAMIGRVDAEVRRHRKVGGAQAFLREVFGMERTMSGATSVLSRWRTEGISYPPHLAMLVRWARPPREEVVGLLAEMWACEADTARALIAIDGIERVFARWSHQAIDVLADMTYLIGYARGS